MLKLEVKNEKKQKVVYEQDFIPGRKVREVLEMLDEFYNLEIKSEVEALDRKVEFVASLFKDLTTDDIYDGIEAPKLLKTLDEVIDQVLGREKKIPQEEK